MNQNVSNILYNHVFFLDSCTVNLTLGTGLCSDFSLFEVKFVGPAVVKVGLGDLYL